MKTFSIVYLESEKKIIMVIYNYAQWGRENK